MSQTLHGLLQSRSGNRVCGRVQGLYLTRYYVRFDSENALERNTHSFYATVISASLPVTWVCLLLLPWIDQNMADSILLAPKIPTVRSRGKKSQVTSNLLLQRTIVETITKVMEFVCSLDLNVIKTHCILFAVRMIRNACFDT